MGLSSDSAKRYKVINYDLHLLINCRHFGSCFRLLGKFINWVDNDELIGNMDARVFHEGLEKQIKELESMLKSIDEEFADS